MVIKLLKTYGLPLLSILFPIVTVIIIHGSIPDSLDNFSLFSGFFSLMGVYWFIQTYRDEQSKHELSKPGNVEVGESATGEITLMPDRLTFVLRNSLSPCMLIAAGIWMNREDTIDDPDFFAMIFFASGLYALINAFVKSGRTLYIIDQAGIRIYEQPMFFKMKEISVSFSDVKKIFYRQAIYEMGRDIGTVFIDDGDKDSDGNIIYAKLMGISNYKEIGRLIKQRTGDAILED